MEQRTRERSADRLVAFTDAVVAIAITLLVLPLIEIPKPDTPPLGELLAERAFDYLGFAISFFVIARLWWAHHRLFEHVVRWSRALVVLNVLWLFTIVLFPVGTAVNTSFDPGANRLSVGLYLAVMTGCSALLTALAALVHRDGGLTDGRDADGLRRLVGSATTTGAFLVALVVGTAVPWINDWALLLLALTGPADRVVMRVLARRRPRRV